MCCSSRRKQTEKESMHLCEFTNAVLMCQPSLFLCTPSVPRDTMLQRRCWTQLWPPPPHSLQSKGRRQVILWMDDGIKIHLCKAINVSISEGRNHIFQIDSTNLCTRGRQRNQFKSVFPIAGSFWTFDNLSCSSELGHGNILCTIQSCYWSLLLFFFFVFNAEFQPLTLNAASICKRDTSFY